MTLSGRVRRRREFFRLVKPATPARRVRFAAKTEILEGYELRANPRTLLSTVRVLTAGAHQGREVEVLTKCCTEVRA